MKLTKSAVDRIQLTAAGQTYYIDSELPGFGLRVGTKRKTYFAESRVNGKTVRVTIGPHGPFTPEQARTAAKEQLRLMAGGVDPNDTKAAAKARRATLGEAFEALLDARKGLKGRTVYDYRRFMGMPDPNAAPPRVRRRDPRPTPIYFRDWKDKPITEITKDMVESRHALIGQTSEAQANLAMRFLRALFNFAAGRYEDSKGQPLIQQNPVKRLSQTKAWYRVERRKTYIKPQDLKGWLDAVQGLGADKDKRKARVVRDYLLLLLLTGLRREEAAKLRWADVDLAAKTLTVRDTKNHEDHTLPLSDFLLEMLQQRKEAAGDSLYVFPGEGPRGYLVEPKAQMAKVSKASGVAFTLHDLRRTFATIAESLDIPAYALKRLLNHKTGSDVTAGYVIVDVERLRRPMQQITDFILKAAGVRESAPVVQLQAVSA